MRDVSLIVQIVLVVASCSEFQWMYACKFSFAFRSRVSSLASKLHLENVLAHGLR